MPRVLVEVFEALGATPFAAFFRDFTTAYATLNAAHIFSFAVVIGSIAALDLKLLGLFRSAPLRVLAQPLSRTAAAGLVFAVVTGFLLFSVRPLAYASNPAFLIKVSLVALGVVNALVLRLNRHWAVAAAGGELHISVRITAALSLATWAGAVLAGRWIGFLQ